MWDSDEGWLFDIGRPRSLSNRISSTGAWPTKILRAKCGWSSWNGLERSSRDAGNKQHVGTNWPTGSLVYRRIILTVPNLLKISRAPNTWRRTRSFKKISTHKLENFIVLLAMHEPVDIVKIINFYNCHNRYLVPTYVSLLRLEYDFSPSLILAQSSNNS